MRPSSRTAAAPRSGDRGSPGTAAIARPSHAHASELTAEPDGCPLSQKGPLVFPTGADLFARGDAGCPLPQKGRAPAPWQADLFARGDMRPRSLRAVAAPGR